MRFASLAISVVAVAVAAGAGCTDFIAPTNPFDPATPIDQQARGTLSGRVVLEDATAAPEAIELQLAALRIVLETAPNVPLLVEGEPRELTLSDVGVVDGAGSGPTLGSGTFTFDELEPAAYAPIVSGIDGNLYRGPGRLAFEVLPGAAVDVGELRFVANTPPGAGPGAIRGTVALDGAAGADANVALFQLRDGAAALFASAPAPGGAFEFRGLPVGTFALVASAAGFASDYRVDVVVNSGDGAVLEHEFSGADALTLRPASTLLQPSLASPSVTLLDGEHYVNGDALDVDLAIGAAYTGMRLSASAADLAALAFTPPAAASTVALPVVEGDVPVFLQLEVRSAAGFVFVNDVFSTSVVRDVSAPVIVDATLLDLARAADGAFLANVATGASATLRTQAQDAVSAVAAVAVVVADDPAAPAPDPAALTFELVSSAGGLVSLDNVVGLAGASGDGAKAVYVFARDRAGNVSLAERIDALLDREAPEVPLVVADAVAGVVPVRDIALAFDPAAAAAAAPVAMQLGLQPLSPAAPILPFDVDGGVVLIDPASAAHDASVAFQARLFDAAGNEALVTSATVRLSLLARLSGTVVPEGFPEIDGDASGALVSVRSSTTGASLASASTDATGAFTLVDVVEQLDGATLEVARPGHDTVTLALPPFAAQRPTDPARAVGTVALPLSRGTLSGAFQRADLTGDATAHAGITVTATLTGAGRTFSDASITGADGSYTLPSLPSTRAGERYVLDARRDDYGAASAESTLPARTVTVVNPDVDGAPLAVLLPRNVGDFDVCPPAPAACVDAQFLNSATTVRVRLRGDVDDVVAIRARARASFDAGDAAPAFVPFDPAVNLTDVDVSGADGLVEVFVQTERADGTRSGVLNATVTKDTVAPALTELRRIAAPGAVDARFTNRESVDVVVAGAPGAGNVAPLAPARAVIASAPPAAPPANAVPCAPSAVCAVALPGADTDTVEERVHRLFAFACDAAGNCSPASETFVIHDRTAPSSAHGAGFTVVDVGGNGGVTPVGGVFVLSSPLYGASLSVGTARTGAGGAVVDEAGAAVADVAAYRFSLQSTTSDALVRALDPAPAAGSDREDVVVPALPAIDGNYTVFAQLVDGAGNVTAVAPINVFSAPLRLDTVPPDVTFALAPAGGLTTSSSVTFNVAVPPGGEVPRRIQVAADGGLFASGVVERTFPLAGGGEPFTLPANGDGSYTVFARIFDDAGNRADRIALMTLDTTPPGVQLASCRTCTTFEGALFTRNAVGVVVDVAAADATTSVTQLDVRVNGGNPTRFAFNGNVTVPLALNVSNAIDIRAVDAAGLVTAAANAAVLTVRHDDVAPAFDAVNGVVAAGGAPATREPVVPVSITASDAAGITGMRLASSATGFAGAVQPFSASTTFTLAAGADGPREVCVELRDGAGNISSRCDAIALDRAAPIGTVAVAGGASFTNVASGAAVALTFDAGTTDFSIATSALDCSSAQYTSASGTSASATINLTGGDGNKTVFACFRDAAGNTSSASDDVLLDTTAPSGTVAIASAATFTTTTVPSIAFATAPDASGVTHVFTQVGGSAPACATVADANYLAIGGVTTVNLGATEGARTVFACFRDGAGNKSAGTAVSDGVVVDLTNPAVAAFTVNGTSGTALTNATTVTVEVTATDANAPLQMALANNALDCATATYGALTSPVSHAIPSGAASTVVHLCVRDAAGRTTVTGNNTRNVTLDTTPPALASPAVSIVDGGDGLINASGSVNVTLAWTTAGDVAFVKVAEGAIDCASSAGYVAAGAGTTATVSATLAAGDGTKTVVACFKDAAGNVATASDDTLLDATAPSGTVAIAGGATFTTTTVPSIAFATAPDASGVTHVFTQVGGSAPACATVADANYLAIGGVTTVDLGGGEGARTVFACFRDGAGNKSAGTAVSDGVVVDLTNPAVTAFTVNGTSGTALTNATTVTVEVTATDANAPLQMALANNALDCAAATYGALTSPVSHAIPSGAATTVVHLCVRDAAGRTTVTGDNTRTVTLDTTPPALASPAVTINDGGDGFIITSGAPVNVALAWTTAGDVAFVKAAEGAIDCASSAGYVAAGAGTSTTLSFTPTAGDGVKTVLACFKDGAGNVATSSDTSTVDTAVPTGTIVAAGGAAKTRLTTLIPVSVTTSAPDATQMAIVDVTAGTAGVCAAASYVALAPTATLAAFATTTNESKRIGVCFRDQAGNQTVNPAFDPITLDNTIVSTGINGRVVGTGKNGASTAFTRVASVTVEVSGAAADIVEIEIANDATFIGATLDVFGNGVIYPFTLDPGDGVKDVFVRLRDDAGNTVVVSNNNPAPTDFSITLDTSPPSVPAVTIASGAQFSTTAAPSVRFEATGATEVMIITPENDVDSEVFAAATFPLTQNVTIENLTTDGVKPVRAVFRDDAGNESGTVSDDITLDRVLPCNAGVASSISVNQGAPFANESVVDVDVLNCADSGEDVPTSMRVNCNAASAAGAALVPFSSTFTCVLSAGDGPKDVSFIPVDAAGNEGTNRTDAITVDTIVPLSPSLSVPASAATGVNHGCARVNSSDETTLDANLARVEARVNGGAFVNCAFGSGDPDAASPCVYNAATNRVGVLLQQDRDNLIEVRAVDLAGNVGEPAALLVNEVSSQLVATSLTVKQVCAGGAFIILKDDLMWPIAWDFVPDGPGDQVLRLGFPEIAVLETDALSVTPFSGPNGLARQGCLIDTTASNPEDCGLTLDAACSVDSSKVVFSVWEDTGAGQAGNDIERGDARVAVWDSPLTNRGGTAISTFDTAIDINAESAPPNAIDAVAWDDPADPANVNFSAAVVTGAFILDELVHMELNAGTLTISASYDSVSNGEPPRFLYGLGAEKNLADDELAYLVFDAGATNVWQVRQQDAAASTPNLVANVSGVSTSDAPVYGVSVRQAAFAHQASSTPTVLGELFVFSNTAGQARGGRAVDATSVLLGSGAPAASFQPYYDRGVGLVGWVDTAVNQFVNDDTFTAASPKQLYRFPVDTTRPILGTSRTAAGSAVVVYHTNSATAGSGVVLGFSDNTGCFN